MEEVTVEEIVTRKTDKKLEWSFIKSAKILHEDEAFAVVTYRYVIRSRHSNNKASSMWQVCVKARYRGDVEVQEAPALFVVILLVGQIRRILSVTAVRAQAECLLSRLRNVGSGTIGHKCPSMRRMSSNLLTCPPNPPIFHFVLQKQNLVF